MRALLIMMVLSLIPAKAEVSDIQCPGQNTLEMRWCATKNLQESRAALDRKLSRKTLQSWRQETQEVCAAAYGPYLQGTIYPQLVLGCEDRLNRALMRELKGLGEKTQQPMP